MFDSYSERPARKQLKWGAVVVLSIILLVTFIEMTCRTPEDAEIIINSSPALLDHDRYCKTLPLAGDFKLRFRSVGGNSYIRSISYWYASELRFSEVATFFEDRMKTDGWTMTSLYQEDMTPVGKHIDFEKGEYRISIESAVAPTKYVLNCSKVVNR